MILTDVLLCNINVITLPSRIVNWKIGYWVVQFRSARFKYPRYSIWSPDTIRF